MVHNGRLFEIFNPFLCQRSNFQMLRCSYEKVSFSFTITKCVAATTRKFRAKGITPLTQKRAKNSKKSAITDHILLECHNLELATVALCHLHLVALPDIECTVLCVHLIAFLMLTLWLHHKPLLLLSHTVSQCNIL